MSFKIFIPALLIFFHSCDLFRKSDERRPIARVNQSFLYEDDILDLVSETTSKSDSILLVRNFINRWATQQLFVDGALLNLSEEKQVAFNKLVEQYKNDLYAKAYIEALVKQNIDTFIPKKKAEKYYEANKEAFKLNEEIIKFRYININEDIMNFESIREKFKRYNSQDKKFLDSISMQFKSYSLNDSIWIKWSQVVRKIAVVNSENKNQLLKKSNFLQIKDSIGVYLMKINDVLLRNHTAPLEYVRPTINQIVINKRKLEIIRTLEKDITEDAYKNKKFEIYN